MTNFILIGDESKEEYSAHSRSGTSLFPKEVQGYTIDELDLVNYNDLVKGEVTNGLTQEIPINNFYAINTQSNQAESRILLITKLVIGFYRVHSSPGDINQSFSIFPRETLEVEISDSRKISKTKDQTQTIIDSNNVSDTSSFAETIKRGTGSSDKLISSWEKNKQITIEAKAGGVVNSVSGRFSEGSSSSSSTSTTRTVNSINEELEKQSMTASISRKAEMRVNVKEETEEEKSTTKKRILFNPNFDKPLNLVVYDSIGHYLNLTQVVGITLIHQSKKNNEEYIQDINTIADLEAFVESVVKENDNKETLKNTQRNLKKKLQDAISYDEIKYDENNNKTYRTPYYPLSEKSTNMFKLNTKRKFGSTYIEETAEDRETDALVTHKVRVRGLVIGVHECQLNSGDVIGEVTTGIGDARGKLSRDVHDLNLESVRISNKIQQTRSDVIEHLKSNFLSVEDQSQKLKWADLVVKALNSTNIETSASNDFE